MDNQDRFQITSLDMAIVMMSMIVGIGILTMPRSLTKSIGTADGWISIAIAGVLIMVLIFLYVRLQKQFPNQTLFGYLAQQKVGKWISTFLGIGYFIYFISLLALEGRVLALVTKMYLLDNTPAEVLVGIILLVTTFAVTKGIQGIVHLCLMFMPIIFVLGSGILLANAPNVDLENMLPIMGEGILPILDGVTEISLSYLGFEILLFMMMYMKKSEIRAWPINVSIGIITFAYIWAYVFAVSIFGVEAVQYITFPTVEAAKEIEVPGAFFERVESFLITIWIMTIFNTMSIAHLLAYKAIKSKMRKLNDGILLAAIAFVTIILAFIPESITELFSYADYVGWWAMSLFIISLLSGYMTVWYRKRKSTHTHKGDVA